MRQPTEDRAVPGFAANRAERRARHTHSRWRAGPRVRAYRVVLTSLLVGSGCAGDRGGATPGPAVERRFVDVEIDTLWTRGSITDTVIELPLHLAVDGDILVLADGARRGVAALNTEDGSTLWTAGRQGRGPGEYERPGVLEFLPDGRLLVADVDVGRVTILERDGRYVAAFPLEDAHVTGLCALADGAVVATATTDGDNVRVVGLDGATHAVRPAPWPELRAQSQLARQFVVSTAADRRSCLIALSIGRGFASFDGDRFSFTRDYVEPVPTPSVEVRETGTRTRVDRSERLDRPTLSTRTVASSADLHYVVFEGATPEAGRILDAYTLQGAYDHSLRLRRRVHRLAWSQGVFYVLSMDGGLPIITALRVRRIA